MIIQCCGIRTEDNNIETCGLILGVKEPVENTAISHTVCFFHAYKEKKRMRKARYLRIAKEAVKI